MRAYKYKLRTSKAFAVKLQQTLDACRTLYNAALEERINAWKINRVSVSYADQCKQLTDIREFDEQTASVYSQVAQDALRRLNKAFDNFFRRVKAGNVRAGFPRFKGANRFDSFCYPQQGFHLKGDKLILSKIGSCRIRLHREIVGKIKTCCIKREANGWYVVLTCESEVEPLPKTLVSVGIDVGLAKFATLTCGEPIENPRYLRKATRRLKRLQRSVSRKRGGSGRRKKSVHLLQKQHLKVKRQRLDFFHKESLKLVKAFDEIAVEDLNISGMVKNHALAKSISDVAWGTFLNILESKAENAAKRVWRVNPRGTSQECSNCGETVKKALNVRVHRCSCGLEINRDLNAAFNILGRADRLRANVGPIGCAFLKKPTCL